MMGILRTDMSNAAMNSPDVVQSVSFFVSLESSEKE